MEEKEILGAIFDFHSLRQVNRERLAREAGAWDKAAAGKGT